MPLSEELRDELLLRVEEQEPQPRLSIFGAVLFGLALLVAVGAGTKAVADGRPTFSGPEQARNLHCCGARPPLDFRLSLLGNGEEIKFPALDHLLAYVGAPHGRLFAPPYGFDATTGIFGVWLSGGTFIIVELVLLAILEFMPSWTSNFVSRKMCHAGSGLLFLTLDSHSASARGAMYLVGIASILMTWEITKDIGLRPFRFGDTQDVGITIYLMIVMLWFFGELPARALSPMFFADPAGAIVGKFLSHNYPHANKRWIDKKTIGGSFAVLVVTCATLLVFYPPMPRSTLVALSVAAMVAEAVGGKYDNLALAFVVIGGYYLLVGSA
mmetsp:Transcript_136970/g.438185  ORF Transcript_136970/g.438185 Transcript_136970/m.438185 type:complete len:327 (-) Transcript_136970:114-1094(-)